MRTKRNYRGRGGTDDLPFWKRKSLTEMTPQEWESLCDHCGLCCLCKIEYEDTGEVCYTNVCCSEYDIEHTRCRIYAHRAKEYPQCAILSPSTIQEFPWLPESCAYRRLHLKLDLPDWHPLVCGDRERIHRLGKSIRGRVISETHVHIRHLENHIVDINHW